MNRHSVEEISSVPGTPFDDIEVIGKENDTSNMAEKVGGPYRTLTVHPYAAPATSGQLRFDHRTALAVPYLTSHHGRLAFIIDQCFVGRSPKRPERGQIGSRLEKICLSRAVWTDEDVDARIWFDAELTVRAEVAELEP